MSALPGKAVSKMTYTVSGGTLTHSLLSLLNAAVIEQHFTRTPLLPIHSCITFKLAVYYL